MKYAALALILLSACEVNQTKFVVHPPTSIYPKRIIPVAIDADFTSSEKEQLLQSLTDWNLALNHEIALKVFTSHFDMRQADIDYIYAAHGFVMLRVSELGPVAHNLDDNIVAMTDAIGGHLIYFIAEKIKISQLRYRANHEIAHILGASHTNYGIMKREYDPFSYSCIDYSAISQIAQYNNIDVDKLNWCVK